MIIPSDDRLRRIRSIHLALALSALLPAVGCTPVRHDPVLARTLPPILHRLDDSGAVVSARVIELPSGRELFADHPNRPLTPASNMKLIVTAAALDALGPDFTYDTYLVRSGDDLWIVGTGDPALGDFRIGTRHQRDPFAVLDEWTDLLRRQGITRIPGDLCYDESWFERKQVHDHWAEDDRAEWYACPVSGLNFNDNCIDVTVTPADPGEPVRYSIAPPTRVATIVNHCLSHGEGKPARIARDVTRNVFTLSGRATKQTELPSKPVTHPGVFLADAFRLALEKNGICVAGDLKPITVRRDECGAPLDGEILAVHRTALADVLWRTNTHSQNLFAECLAKTLGRRWAASWRLRQPGSWDNARRAVPDRIRRLGVSTGGLKVADGSGLSHGNKVTARLLTDLLQVMYSHPNAAAYRQSLSKAGVEGTLRNRMKDLKGRVFAKTGYINSVRTLSGYVQTRDGKWLAFSFLYNRIPGSVTPFEKLQDEAVRVLAEWSPQDHP